MGARPLVLVIAIYVGLDLTNPFTPGAFTFDAQESVEGLHRERDRQHLVALADPVFSGVQRRETPPPPRRPAPVARKRSAEPRPGHVPASDPPPVSEDH